MQTLTVNAADIPRLTDYRRHVVKYGHLPGVLSGAELQGKAKNYGGSYARSRDYVADVLRREYAVYNRLILQGSPARWQRVWTDSKGQPVALKIQEKE